MISALVLVFLLGAASPQALKSTRWSRFSPVRDFFHRENSVINSLIRHAKAPKPGLTVIGGQTVQNPNSWPWVASLQFRDDWDQQYYHVCGATLIHPGYVITAAHCLDENLDEPGRNDPSRYRVMLGGKEQYQLTEQEQFLDVEAFIIHPSWRSDPNLGYPDDLALIRLSGSADVSRSAIDVIELPTGNRQFSGDSCWLQGWGVTHAEDEHMPTHMQEAATPVLSTSQCQNSLPLPVTSNQICSGGEDQPIMCAGDSGSPLTCQEGSVWKLTGVTSWSYNYCEGYPTVFTRISAYSTWIHNNMR